MSAGVVEAAAPVVDSGVVEEWQRLADQTEASPFLRPAWVLARHRGFSPGASIELLTVRRDGALVGILPLFHRRGSLVSFDGYDTEAGPVALDDDARRALADRLLATHCAVDLRSVAAEDPWVGLLGAASRRAGASVSVEAHRRSLFVDVEGSFEAYEGSLGRNRRQNARRRWRRLAEQGSLTFEMHNGSTDLADLLHEGFRVEASGWKGESGTAVLASPPQRRFYDELARSAVATGDLRLYFLRLDGRPLAFSFDLTGGGAQYHLKGGFDEAFADFSPGILIRMRIIEQLCGDPHIGFYDLLGQPDGWKEQLATGGRDRVRIRLHPRGVVGSARHVGRLTAARARAEAERRLPEPAWAWLHRNVRRIRRPI